MIVVWLVGAAHVITSGPVRLGDACIAEEDGLRLARGIGRIVYAAERVGAHPPRLVEPGCNRLVYEWDAKHRVIVFRAFADRGAPVQAFSDTGERTSEACWMKGQRDLERLDLPVVRQLMSDFRRVHPVLVDDRLVGPARWLDCKRDADYARSLEVLVHETSHLLATSTCLFSSRDGRSQCFALSPLLPPRSVAAYETDDALARYFQAVYLIAGDSPPMLLFNELNAYALGARAMLATVERFGPAVWDEGRHASATMVPLFLLLTKRYLQHVKTKYPQQYASNFETIDNQAALNAIIGGAEEAYRAWSAKLPAFSLRPSPSDERAWKQYERGSP